MRKYFQFMLGCYLRMMSVHITRFVGWTICMYFIINLTAVYFKISYVSSQAAGSVIELADKVISGEVKNGFAFVRPPGHHALPNQAM